MLNEVEPSFRLVLAGWRIQSAYPWSGPPTYLRYRPKFSAQPLSRDLLRASNLCEIEMYKCTRDSRGWAPHNMHPCRSTFPQPWTVTESQCVSCSQTGCPTKVLGGDAGAIVAIMDLLVLAESQTKVTTASFAFWEIPYFRHNSTHDYPNRKCNFCQVMLQVPTITITRY